MRITLPLITAIAATGLIGASATAFGPAERKAKELAAWTPQGKPVSCITTRNIRSTKVLADNVIDFEVVGGKRYRNVLPSSCPQLNWEGRFSHRSVTGQLCDVDIITVLEQGGHGLESGPSCGLGEFQPVVRVDGRR